jgi:hypothetical protein
LRVRDEAEIGRDLKAEGIRQTGLEQYDPDSGLMLMGYGEAGRR